MQVLIIHHLQTMWEESYNKFGTTCFDLCVGIKEHIEENSYDQVILTQFENFQAESIHENTELSYSVDRWEEYGYGWESSMFSNESEYCEGGAHSEVVYLPDWLKNLKGAKVDLCGAFDGECIEDMEIALNHCDIPFNRIEQFIV